MSETPVKNKASRKGLRIQLNQQIDINYAQRDEIRRLEKKMLRNNFWLRLFKVKILD